MFWKTTKLYFVHIPKNAGNSIRNVCRKLNIKVITHNIRKPNKQLLASYRGKKSIHAFCVSRNPYDRVVSAYYYLLNNKKHKHDIADRKKFIDPYFDFNEFVKKGLQTAADNQLHFIPQVFWIKNNEGYPEVETILKLENLQEDLDVFCKKIGMPTKKLEIENSSTRKRNWRDYYTEETKNIVSEIYHDDFEFFEYKK